MMGTYNGGDSKLLLTGVLEELENVISVDDASLAAKVIGTTHICGLCCM